MEKIFTTDDLMTMNELMLGRNAPVTRDGIGYNKADYSICANYLYGMSDAQMADLADRLIKYSNTQLLVDKDAMKSTADYYKSLIKNGEYSGDGVSINITENGTEIGFRYNQKFIDVIKARPNRRFDGDKKQWVVPNSDVILTLKYLRRVGADVKNAIAYAKSNELISTSASGATDERLNVAVVYDDNKVYVKFDYDELVLNEIRKIDRKARKYNPTYKFWVINTSHFKPIKDYLDRVATLRVVGLNELIEG